MTRVFAPPGWPRQVRPPDAPDWEGTAAAWLFDQCPPDYRALPVLRRHPVVLARFASLHVRACQEGVRAGLSEARGVLCQVAEDLVVEQAVQALHHEEARLLGVSRGVALIEEALQGRRFRARL